MEPAQEVRDDGAQDVDPYSLREERAKGGHVMAGRKKSTPRKKTKYGPTARKDVGRALHELELGELESGRSGRKVTSRKQAIAIGLSEARKSGSRVPPPKGSAAKKAAPKKASRKKK
jgi:hypothetical protein